MSLRHDGGVESLRNCKASFEVFLHTDEEIARALELIILPSQIHKVLSEDHNDPDPAGDVSLGNAAGF